MAARTGLIIIVFVIFALMVGGIIYVSTDTKKKGSTCTPSDGEKTTAGGEGVLNFVYNESGNCVANACVDGYTIGGGICSKSAPATPGGATGGATQDLEGKSIICQGDKDGRFRMVDGKLRSYGSMDILNSWDPGYTVDNASTVDCSSLPKGPTMIYNTEEVEGDSVLCLGDKTGIFRIVDGKLRNYGSMDILKTWDPDYTGSTTDKIDCTGIPEGLAMKLKPN